MIDVSVIIPCYNSAHLIEKRVRDFEEILTHTNWTWEIILTDDASRDETVKICQRLAQTSPNRKLFINQVNLGRGKNVANAIPLTSGRFVGYVDADSSTAAGYVVPLISELLKGNDIAVAKRTYKIRLLELPSIVHRLLTHLGYALLVRRLLGIHNHDTESGCKFFRREVALELTKFSESPGWFWDTEMIANAHLRNYSIVEVPTLFVRDVSEGTTVRLVRDSWLQFNSLWRFSKKVGRQLGRQCCGKNF